MDSKEYRIMTNKNQHLGPHASRVLLPVAHNLGAHASSVLPPVAHDPGPHASRVLVPAAHDLGAHASSVLPQTAKQGKTSKARTSPKPAKSMLRPPLFLARDLTLKGEDLTTVSPLHNSGLTPALSPASSSHHDQPHNPGTGTSVVRLHKTGKGGPARPFSIASIPHAPTLNRDDIPADNRLRNSRRNAVGFYPRAKGVLALHNSANVPPSDPAIAPLKNPSISAVTAEESRPRMVVQLPDEMASHLTPSGGGTIGKAGKISTNSTTGAMDPYLEKSGKNSTNSMNSMPTHVDGGGAAPSPSLQFERGHCGSPNRTRPQFSAEKSVNNSANSASSARPTNEGNCALVPGHPWAFKPGNTPLKNPSISVVTVVESRPRMVMRRASESGGPSQALAAA
jgi:hypothetical protein